MRASPDITRLIEIMAALRNRETGCPWDVAQTHRTLAPYAVEEAYEVVDAIERDDPNDLRDELGDLLLQVVFHARVAQESGAFAFGDIVEAIAEKMIRRHPHVFGAAGGMGSRPSHEDGIAATNVVWDSIKAGERQAKSGPRSEGLLDGIPTALPGLDRAVKLQKRASTVGFDWADARLVIAKIREEIVEIEHELFAGDRQALEGEIGDLLFAVANLARHADLNPETAVRTANRKFERRFAFIESELARQGKSTDTSTLAEMDALWNAAKRQGL